MTETIEVCGVLVHARPEHTATVREALCRRPGVEVHAVTDDGRLVVTVEPGEAHGTSETIAGLNDVDHVLSVSLVYQHSEEVEPDSAG